MEGERSREPQSAQVETFRLCEKKHAFFFAWNYGAVCIMIIGLKETEGLVVFWGSGYAAE